MKALFVTNPGLGHLLPMVSTALALQAAGHEVAVATSASFAPTVEAQGLRAIAAGLDWLESEAARTFPEIEGMSAGEQADWFIGELFADIAAHAMVPDLLALAESWGPDLIVRNDFEFGSVIAAERLGLPHATLSVSFFLPPSVLEPMVGEPLAYLRSLHGLAPYPPLDRLYHYAYFSFAPTRFQPLSLPVMHAVWPDLTRNVRPEDTPAWLAELPDQPTVYASLSGVYRVADPFVPILEALREEPINLIITVGRRGAPERYGPQPPNVRIERFIPQGALFPHCDLFITHNPFATMMAALSYGLPLLMLPMGGELVGGAIQAAEMGVGRILRRPEQPAEWFDAWVPPFSAESVRAAVRELLANPSYRQQAQRMAAEIEALPGPAHIVRLLEYLATHRVPLHTVPAP